MYKKMKNPAKKLAMAKNGTASGLPKKPATVDQSRPNEPMPKTLEPWADYLSGHWAFPNPANEWDCGDGREEVARDYVVSKAHTEDNEEES